MTPRTPRIAPGDEATGGDRDDAARLVIVTGASSGIGHACARALLGAGDRVVAHYRHGERAVAELVAEFGAGRVQPVQADLSVEGGCRALVAAAGGVPRVLVHAAGMWTSGAIGALSAERLEAIYRLNTFAAYYLAREMVNARRQEASGGEEGSETGAATGGREGGASGGAPLPGSIVVIGSTAGERGEPGHSHYAGSKAALWGLVQSLAQELAPAIRVNLVSPGWVRTPMAAAALAEPGREQAIIDGVPLRRIAAPEDVAAAVCFLCDEQAARHLTGIDLPVSGGALLPLPRG